jgi:hypothetical protein
VWEIQDIWCLDGDGKSVLGQIGRYKADRELRGIFAEPTDHRIFRPTRHAVDVDAAGVSNALCDVRDRLHRCVPLKPECEGSEKRFEDVQHTTTAIGDALAFGAWERDSRFEPGLARLGAKHCDAAVHSVLNCAVSQN